MRTTVSNREVCRWSWNLLSIDKFCCKINFVDYPWSMNVIRIIENKNVCRWIAYLWVVPGGESTSLENSMEIGTSGIRWAINTSTKIIIFLDSLFLLLFIASVGAVFVVLALIYDISFLFSNYPIHVMHVECWSLFSHNIKYHLKIGTSNFTYFGPEIGFECSFPLNHRMKTPIIIDWDSTIEWFMTMMNDWTMMLWKLLANCMLSISSFFYLFHPEFV